jgi:transposase InsO family protein
MELVARDFSWPGMRRYIQDYCSGCDTCNRTKAPRHKPFGLLQPLSVPSRPWQSISMDFIIKLPISKGFDSILVVVDRHSKMVHFFPTVESLSSSELAKLFLEHVFKLHGLPDSIISDRGGQFISHFWRSLLHLLKIKPATSTSHHPQTDGQTERTNQTLEAYLRAYCSYQQDDWSDYLPLAEFAHNNLENASTKQSPFYVNYGYHPKFDPSLAPSSVPASADLAEACRVSMKNADSRSSSLRCVKPITTTIRCRLLRSRLAIVFGYYDVTSALLDHPISSITEDSVLSKSPPNTASPSACPCLPA